MIRAVIFDYGGTMTARFESEYSLVSKFFSVSQEEARRKSGGIIHAFQRGEVTEAGFLRSMANVFGYERKIASVASIFGGYSGYNELNREMLGIVKRLRERGYVTALLSNVVQPHVDFNRPRGNYDHFSPVILSCEVGMRKPERGIYELALRRMKRRPGECVFIDDLPKYLAAAERLGIKPILFESPAQVRQELLALGLAI